MNAREVLRRLTAAGWWAKRSSARHHLMTNGSKTAMVPHMGRRPLFPETLGEIERQTGVKFT